jgi:hypothetical protein
MTRPDGSLNENATPQGIDSNSSTPQGTTATTWRNTTPQSVDSTPAGDVNSNPQQTNTPGGEPPPATE